MTRHAGTGFATLLSLVIVATAAIVAPLAAQELPTGIWSGSFETPDGAFDVQYEVTGAGDELAVMLVIPSGEKSAFDTVRLEEGVLHIEFAFPNVDVVCELAAADDGSYEGECTGSDGGSGTLTMIPPSDG
ncbi:MAG: hypothetical protein ACC682_12575 [Gemmatimonadota bacterium]